MSEQLSTGYFYVSDTYPMEVTELDIREDLRIRWNSRIPDGRYATDNRIKIIGSDYLWTFASIGGYIFCEEHMDTEIGDILKPDYFENYFGEYDPQWNLGDTVTVNAMVFKKDANYWERVE